MVTQHIHQLQIDQLLHDQRYHADILCLPVQRRANHMALHFAKYAGKLTHAKLNKDRDELISTIIDSFVICLASANMLNLDIGELSILKEIQTKEFSKLGTEIYSFTDYQHEDIYSFSADNMSMAAGEMAKAIESLDHMESYPFREVVLQNLELIIGVVFVVSSFLGLDFIGDTRKRLRGVEKKSIFHRDYESGVLSQQKVG